jgi:hypothetical protein
LAGRSSNPYRRARGVRSEYEQEQIIAELAAKEAMEKRIAFGGCKPTPQIHTLEKVRRLDQACLFSLFIRAVADISYRTFVLAEFDSTVCQHFGGSKSRFRCNRGRIQDYQCVDRHGEMHFPGPIPSGKFYHSHLLGPRTENYGATSLFLPLSVFDWG